jgi:hypothetical protein
VQTGNFCREHPPSSDGAPRTAAFRRGPLRKAGGYAAVGSTPPARRVAARSASRALRNTWPSRGLRRNFDDERIRHCPALVDSLPTTDLGADCSGRMTTSRHLRVQPPHITREAGDDAGGCVDATLSHTPTGAFLPYCPRIAAPQAWLATRRPPVFPANLCYEGTDSRENEHDIEICAHDSGCARDWRAGP